MGLGIDIVMVVGIHLSPSTNLCLKVQLDYPGITQLFIIEGESIFHWVCTGRTKAAAKGYAAFGTIDGGGREGTAVDAQDSMISRVRSFS